MNSLYKISQDFLEIFEELEDNGGELTAELEEKLTITQENYAQKLENYAKVVAQYKSDIAAIKVEKERLDRHKKILENRIDKLENRMFEAVKQFGPVETALFKINTRKSKSIEVETERITNLRNEVIDFAREIHDNGVIAFGEDCDIEGMLAVVNAKAKAKHEIKESVNYTGTEFEPYSLNDLNAVKINISSTSSIANLFMEKDGILETVLNNEARFIVDNDINKTELKADLSIYPDITIAGIKENEKLSIK